VYTLEIDSKLIKKVKKSGNVGLKKKLQSILKSPKAYGEPLRNDLTGFYKGRSDPYRIIYEVDDEQKTVRIISIDTRDDVYENFNPQNLPLR
jgi:mRNA interferase RelE/StbE